MKGHVAWIHTTQATTANCCSGIIVTVVNIYRHWFEIMYQTVVKLTVSYFICV